MKNKPKQTTRSLRLDAETAAALDDAAAWLESVSGGGLCDSPKARQKQLNLILRAACEAVINCDGPGVTWPIAFTARPETVEESELGRCW